MKQIYHFDETVVVGCTESCNFVKRISLFLCNFHEKILPNPVITRPVFPKGSHPVSQNWPVGSKSYLLHTFSSSSKVLCHHCPHSAKHTHDRYIWYTYTYHDAHLGKSSQLIYVRDTQNGNGRWRKSKYKTHTLTTPLECSLRLTSIKTVAIKMTVRMMDRMVEANHTAEEAAFLGCSRSFITIRLSTTGINTLRPRQNGRHFADDVFKCIFLNEMCEFCLRFHWSPKGPINNIPPLVQVMAWRRPGDKPLSEPMVVRFFTQICVARPQWVIYKSGHDNKRFLLLAHSHRASG